MKHAIEMGSVAVIHNFKKDWFRHSKFDKGGIHRQVGDWISLL
jgi:hypothetical protein